jgi:phage terminase large subunit GpA-like protein
MRDWDARSVFDASVSALCAYSKQRIAPMIEESSALRDLVADTRSRDSGNTVLAKEFAGGVLVITRVLGGKGARVAASSLDPNSEIGGSPRGDAACVGVSRGC